MSVPTSRTSRSPFSRSPRSSAAVPGAPDAVHHDVSGFTRGRFCRAAGQLEARRSVGVEERLHRLAHRRRRRRPRSPGASSSCSHSNSPRRELLVRAAVAPVLVRVRAVVRRIEERRLHDVDRAGDRLRACTRDPGCARRRPGRSARRGRRSDRRRGARRGGRARAGARARARPRTTRGCRRPSASSGTTSTTRPPPPPPRRPRAPRRARGRRRGAGSGRRASGAPVEAGEAVAAGARGAQQLAVVLGLVQLTKRSFRRELRGCEEPGGCAFEKKGARAGHMVSPAKRTARAGGRHVPVSLLEPLVARVVGDLRRPRPPTCRPSRRSPAATSLGPRIAHSTSTSSSARGRLGALERLEVRVRDRDHVAAAVAVEPHRADRLADLQVRCPPARRRETRAPCRAGRSASRAPSAAAPAPR